MITPRMITSTDDHFNEEPSNEGFDSTMDNNDCGGNAARDPVQRNGADIDFVANTASREHAVGTG